MAEEGEIVIGKVLQRGDPEAVAEFKASSMADAMRLARERVREVEDPDPDPYGYVQEVENENKWDLLPKMWKAKPDDQLWNKRFKARARRAMVAQLYVTGHKVQDIAKQVEASEVTVYRDIQMIMQDWRKSYLDNIETIATKDLATLDYMLSKLAPGIEMGNPKSISVALAIIQERGNILGTKAGVQIDITAYIREVAEAAGFDPDKAVALAHKLAVTIEK